MDATVTRPGLFARLFGRKGGAAPAPAVDVLPSRVPEVAAPAPTASAAIKWYRLGSCRGKPVTLLGDPPGLGYADRLDAAHALLAAVPVALPHVCVLLAPDGRPFAVMGDTAATGIATSALIMQTDLRGVVRLKYPVASAAFLIAMPEEPLVRFDGAGDTMDAAFAMVAAPEADIPQAARALGAEIGGAASEYLRAAPLLARLASGALRWELAEALIRVMPRDELAEFARLLLDRPRELALLARQMPRHSWLDSHLTRLAAWQKTRDPLLAEALRFSPQAEGLALHAVKNAGLVSAGLALHTLARRQILPRRMVCLIATAKNEGVYLLDWIAYHLSIGFEHIFLYTNDNQDGSDALLEALDRARVITWIRNERGTNIGAQEKAYGHALTMVPQILDYRWAAVIDLDEYIGFDPKMFDSIVDFIGFQETQSVDAIALCWQLFAALPGDRWNEHFTPARMTLREVDANKHVKTILRPRQFWWTQPHYPTATMGYPYEYRLQDGTIHHHPAVRNRIAAFAEKPSAEQAWVNHYIVRTADEVLWKWHRGRANWLDKSQHEWFLEFLSQNFVQLAQPERLVEDTRLLECAAGQGAVRERLLALPGVAEADTAIKSNFVRELARIRAEFLANEPAREHDAVRQLRLAVRASSV
jgi:hypothetical protein